MGIRQEILALNCFCNFSPCVSLISYMIEYHSRPQLSPSENFCYILLTYQFSLSGCLYFVRYWAGNMCIVIVSFPGRDVIVLKIILSFNQVAFSAWSKRQDKHLNILRTKKAFKVKWKTFFFIFEEL